MDRSGRMREQLRAYRKLALANWKLFRQSQVGVIGLAIIIAFVLMALLAPFLNLRDPIRWTAPPEDTLEIQRFWETPVRDREGTFFSGTGPVNTSLAMRIMPSSFGAVVDRIYLASGQRLYAFTSWAPTPAWRFSPPGNYVVLGQWSTGDVSADPVVVNYGDFVGSLGSNPRLPEYFIYVGMDDGQVLVFRDYFNSVCIQSPDDPRCRDQTQKAALVWRGTVDASVTSIAVYNPNADRGRTGEERVAVATASGKVYLFRVEAGAVGVGPNPPVNHTQYAVWDSGQAQPVNLADGPMRGLSAVPQWSPAFSRRGTRLAVGTADGVLHLLNAEVGAPSLEEWNRTIYPPERREELGNWTAAPVIANTTAASVHSGREVVYAAAAAGWIFPFYLTGEAIDEWREFAAIPPWRSGGTQIGPSLGRADTGLFTQPSVYGEALFVGSSSGCVYSVRITGEGTAGPGSVRWPYCDDTLLGLEPQFLAPPVALEAKAVLLVGIAVKPTPTATNWTDGVFYSMAMDTGDLNYRVDLDYEAIRGKVVTWQDPENIREGVWFIGTGDTKSTVYSYDTSGNVLTPSLPSWANQHECEEGDPGATSRETEEGTKYFCPGYPSGNAYWLGLDSRGRDVFSQLIWGSRIALLVGLLSAFFSVLISVVVGLVAGYLGGRVDSILMRFTDVILVIPGLPLIIIMAAVIGASVWNIILILALLGWSGGARVIRAEVLSLKERPFIESARVTGASATRIMFRHIAPNVMPLAFLFMTFGVSGAILSEAALSFIGFGDVNTMSWGIMLFYVQQSKALESWWWLLPPGLAITLLSLAFFLVGRAFDEIVNPRLRKR